MIYGQNCKHTVSYERKYNFTRTTKKINRKGNMLTTKRLVFNMYSFQKNEGNLLTRGKEKKKKANKKGDEAVERPVSSKPLEYWGKGVPPIGTRG